MVEWHCERGWLRQTRHEFSIVDTDTEYGKEGQVVSNPFRLLIYVQGKMQDIITFPKKKDVGV